jgi:hypothetical protein
MSRAPGAGSLLFLPAGIGAPAGYGFLGSYEVHLKTTGQKPFILRANAYQKQ